jgi:hypothetical protein
MEQAMTKVLKVLGGSWLAAVLGVVLFAASGALSATTVSAESPPNPPSRFVGSVLVDGQPATSGTLIEARIGSTTCGATTVFLASGQARYVLDSPALDPGATPNCGVDGAVVTFYVGGRLASETGAWHNYQLNTVNLSVVTVTATVTTTPGAGTTPTASVTPRPPVTGNTFGESSDSASWLFAVLGIGALALGAGGVTVARRSR